MDKRPAAAAEPLQGRHVQPERGFVLARASQTAPPSCDSAGEPSGKRFPAVAIPPSWAARHSADADLDGEILDWIVSHLPPRKRLKIPH